MSQQEPSGYDRGEPWSRTTTLVYDAQGNFLRSVGPIQTFYYDCAGRGSEPGSPAEPVGQRPPKVEAARPAWTHTFEFRLCGNEGQEQTQRLAGDAHGIAAVAATAVRAYLTRGDAATPASPIGGIEVATELRGDAIVCTARVNDLPAGDLVVVQVDVALFWLA